MKSQIRRHRWQKCWQLSLNFISGLVILAPFQNKRVPSLAFLHHHRCWQHIAVVLNRFLRCFKGFGGGSNFVAYMVRNMIGKNFGLLFGSNIRRNRQHLGYGSRDLLNFQLHVIQRRRSRLQSNPAEIVIRIG